MDSIRDALAQSASGRQVLVDVKAREIAIKDRRQQVLDLIRFGFPGRPDIIAHARTVEHTGELIKTGGLEYEKLVAVLKYAQTDRRSALNVLGLLKA
jgi:hypothetical protein